MLSITSGLLKTWRNLKKEKFAKFSLKKQKKIKKSFGKKFLLPFVYEETGFSPVGSNTVIPVMSFVLSPLNYFASQKLLFGCSLTEKSTLNKVKADGAILS